MHRINSTYQSNQSAYLRDPALGIPIPFVVANILLGQCNAILERNALPAVFHKVANVLMISSVGVGLDIPVVLSPKLEGGLLVHVGKGGVAQKLGTAGILSRSVDNVAVLEFNESVLVVLVNDLNDLLEHEIVAGHLHVGVEHLALVGDGLAGLPDLVEHAGGGGHLDGTAERSGSIPSKLEYIGLVGLGADLGGKLGAADAGGAELGRGKGRGRSGQGEEGGGVSNHGEEEKWGVVELWRRLLASLEMRCD